MKEELKVDIGIGKEFVSKETQKEICDFIKARVEMPDNLIGLFIEMQIDAPMIVRYTCYAKAKK